MSGRGAFTIENQDVALRDTPKGPVRELVRELIGPCVPSSTALHRDGASGRRYCSTDGTHVDVLRSPDGSVWTVRWTDENYDAQARSFEPTISWREVTP